MNIQKMVYLYFILQKKAASKKETAFSKIVYFNL